MLGSRNIVMFQKPPLFWFARGVYPMGARHAFEKMFSSTFSTGPRRTGRMQRQLEDNVEAVEVREIEPSRGIAKRKTPVESFSR